MANEASHTIVGVSLAPDPVIEAFKKNVDRTLIRESLKLTPGERVQKLQSFMTLIHAARGAGQVWTSSPSGKPIAEERH